MDDLGNTFDKYGRLTSCGQVKMVCNNCGTTNFADTKVKDIAWVLFLLCGLLGFFTFGLFWIVGLIIPFTMSESICSHCKSNNIFPAKSI